MLLIPQKLIDDPRVKVLAQANGITILQKKLSKTLRNRESFVSQHAISIVLNGVQQIRAYDGEVFQLKPGEIGLLSSDVYMISDLLPYNEAFESILFFFDNERTSDFLLAIGNKFASERSASGLSKIASTKSVEAFLGNLPELFDHLQHPAPELIGLKLSELFYLLLAGDDSEVFLQYLSQLSQKRPRNLKVFMDKHFDKPMKIEDYAYLTGRSLTSFRREFKQYFDTTPNRWLRNKRMEKAVELLESMKMSVTEVAFEVGYENLSYFIKAFKQKYSVSPKQFLIQHRAESLMNPS